MTRLFFQLIALLSIKAKGHLWHKSSMKKKVVPRSGIDTDARWGFSHTKSWVFGYKLHMVASTGSITVPLSADFTTANIPDNQMYSILTARSSLPVTIIKKTLYMSADPGYDDHELYDLGTELGFRLVCPVQRYKSTSADRIKLIKFYKSKVGQAILLFEEYIYRTVDRTYQICVRIDPLPVRGHDRACAIVLY